VRQAASPAIFVAAYGEIGLLSGSSSENGIFEFTPYTELEEPKMNFGTRLIPRRFEQCERSFNIRILVL
jgi:hypothetical protein